jgi:hypothetical protein
MLVSYESLSKKQRRAAQKLAKELLRTTPPTDNFDPTKFGNTIRGHLSTAYLKPRNVLAAYVYTDDKGHWWGDVVLKKGAGTVTIGVAEDLPCGSYAGALGRIKRNIANIKAMTEHPVVEQFRRAGYDPEDIALLRVVHRKLGACFVLRRNEQVPTEAGSFRERWKLTEETDKAVSSGIELASAIVLNHAEEFAGTGLLEAPTDTKRYEDEVKMWHEAASFLLDCGIVNISDEDDIDVIVVGTVGTVRDQNGNYSADLKLPPAILNSLRGNGAVQAST